MHMSGLGPKLDQEATMSLLDKGDVYEGRSESIKRKSRFGIGDSKPEVGFILALICAALAVTVAAALFAPSPVARQAGTDVAFVGP
jgi:hypothetical protein